MWRLHILIVVSLIWSTKTAPLDDAECSISHETKEDCGFHGITEVTCAESGCCWEECIGCDPSIPWCFRSAAMLVAECQVVDGAREDCGYFGIDQKECQDDGCCWVPPTTTEDAPWCFRATDANLIRLADGSAPAEGRLEVFLEGSWGTVCDDDFGVEDATVACMMLGYSFGFAVSDGAFGEGSGSIHLDQVNCEGTESSLLECSANPIGVSDCSHSEDVGVICAMGDTESEYDGQVRLVGWMGADEGFVEVNVAGVWGSICDDGFEDKEAMVVCGMLGHVDGYFKYTHSLSNLQGPIHLDDVSCEGHEVSIFDCKHDPIGDHNCAHSEDVYVICGVPNPIPDTDPTAGYFTDPMATGTYPTGPHSTADTPTQGYATGPYWGSTIPGWMMSTPGHHWTTQQQGGTDPANGLLPIRLEGGTASAGRVEIFYNGAWGTICDDDFDKLDARVVCGMMDYHYAKLNVEDFINYYGTGPIHLNGVDCNGGEASLLECGHYPWGVNDCSHSEDVAVECSNTPEDPHAMEGDIRLANGNEPSEGRVEIFLDGYWGTISDQKFEFEEAAVVCRQLGLPETAIIYKDVSVFGEGSGPVNIHAVFCFGDEELLIDCDIMTDVGYSTHYDDVGIKCGAVSVADEPGEEGEWRLTPVGDQEFSGMPSGRLELYHQGQWSTVCDDGFLEAEVQVACRTLGYNGGFLVTSGGMDHEESDLVPLGPIILDEVDCYGTENTLLDCYHNPLGEHNCLHSEDVVIVCTPGEIAESGFQVRLEDGPDESSGRVEIGKYGVWGTVCDDSWDDKDATVLCRMLGYESGIGHQGGYFPGGTGDIVLDDVMCTGNEPMLDFCDHQPYMEHNCGHSEDAGATCSN